MKAIIEENVRPENLKFYKTTQAAYLFGVFGHISLMLGFILMNVQEMILFNVIISIPSFLLAMVMNRKGKHDLAFAFAFFELLFHQIISIYFLGSGTGFQYWFVYLAALSFFNPHWKNKVRFLLLGIVIASFVLIYFFFDDGIYHIPSIQFDLLFLGNSLSTIVVTSLLINYYSVSANKAENELINKNSQIEAQREQIIQSITYAERIQKASMPDEKVLSDYFTDYFIYFRPKDIVSGDYYWFSELDDKVVVALADCTGHGVPGGFMSMLGISLLNELVNHQQITKPAKILEAMREKVKEALSQTGKHDEQKDGMDMSVCIFDKNTKELSFAGANNSIIIIDNNELTELKPTRNPIGVFIKEIPFQETSIQLNNGAQVYHFTDGYIDQFDGAGEKKFMKKRFKQTLLEKSDLVMELQKKNLNKSLNDWKQTYHQLDDISVIGFKV